MSTMIVDIHVLSTAEIAERCREETQKFLKKQPHDQCYGLELFRRAVALHDERAWEALYSLYAPLLRSWIDRYPGAERLREQEGMASLVNAIFARFFCAMTPEKLSRFEALAQVVKYLKLCTHSTLCDELRHHTAKADELALEDVAEQVALDGPEEAVVSSLWAQGLWQQVAATLTDEAERVYLRAYLAGFKPREMCRRSPHLFPNVDAVHNTRHRIQERLGRNWCLRAWRRTAVA